MEEKYIEKEETGRAEITIAGFFAILKSKILLIIVITLIASIIGSVFAYFDVPKYTASGSIMVNVKLDESKESYNDTVLTEMYIPTFVEFVKSDVVMSKANEIYESKGIDDTTISAKSLTIETVENVFILNLSYVEKFNGDEDETMNIAKEKLNAIFEAVEDVVSQTKDVNNEMVPKYFPISITISELQEYTSVSVSDSKVKIIIFAFVIGLVLGVIVALLLEHLDETVKSLDDVRKITNVKTVIGMEDLQNRGKK